MSPLLSPRFDVCRFSHYATLFISLLHAAADAACIDHLLFAALLTPLLLIYTEHVTRHDDMFIMLPLPMLPPPRRR